MLIAVSPTAAAASSAAASSTIAAIASAASGMLGFGASLVHVERAAANLRAIQRGDRLFSFFIAGHLDETKSSRAPGISVRQDAYTVDLSVRFEQLPQLIFGGAEAQIAHKNILHASASALPCRECKLNSAGLAGRRAFLEIETGAGEQSNARAAV